jgi:uncharacterized membrane protein YedE/YeeE
LTAGVYTRRMKEFDRKVLIGGMMFGVGWGLSGICPGAAHASLGIGNYPILWAVVGILLGAYAQGYWCALRSNSIDDATETISD